MKARKRFGLGWDMGLGKTPAAATVGGRAHLRRWLILCPDNAFSVWRDLAPQWIKAVWPGAYVHVVFIDLEPWNRDILWDTQEPQNPDEVSLRICTPDTFIRDWAETIKVPGKKKKMVRFRPRPNYLIPNIVIFDEAKRIRNPDSIMFQVIQKYLSFYNVEWFIPMTGTPGHEPKHFWTMLNLIDPSYFRSYWKFLYAFHDVQDGFWGKEVGEPRNLDEWHKILGRYFSVVREDDEGIADQRPPITRQLLSIQMNSTQAKLYSTLKSEMLAELDTGGVIVAQNAMTLITRLRQLLICPQILDPTLTVGAAIQDFAETVEPKAHNVIFTPFTKAFPYFQTYLKNRGHKVYLLQGGMGTSARDEVLSQYRRPGGGTIICSTLYAQAFSLEPATRSYAIGYDWDPDVNRQAEKRLHRLTTHNPITSYYYTFRSTFDERLCNILNIKQQRVNLTIPANLRKLLTGDPL
jgi:SNF2 family DNA or RNA helicase